MNFTQLTDKLPYPAKLKARLSTYHSDIISYAINNFNNEREFKSKIIKAMNVVSYLLIKGDSLPKMPPDDPLINLPDIDDYECESLLCDLYIKFTKVDWDIDDTYVTSTSTVSQTDVPETFKPKIESPTPKEDLYIKPPVVPLFDIDKPWLNVEKDGEVYTIYTSLPIIPETQRDISVTTNVDFMTKSDLMNLYPNQFIRTRAACMYDKIEGLDFDNVLGIIFPITNFSSKQIKDNIIKYPHFYKLKRKVNDKFTSFYSHIEIDGTLYDTLEIWDTLPESKKIPKTTEFIKEYVVRRYLLERDELHIQHKYPMFGSLDPFLTLFTTPQEYQQFGKWNVEEIARSCVSARVQYLQTRNPILRKVYNLS